MGEDIKPVDFVASALRDLKKFPPTAQRNIGYALDQAQRGNKPDDAKPLRGKDFPGAGVLEIVEDFQTNTYRVVYTVRYAEAIYVLHCFQKKAKQGIATPQQEIEIVKQRLRYVEQTRRQRKLKESE